jgi:hypothetical protein
MTGALFAGVLLVAVILAYRLLSRLVTLRERASVVRAAEDMQVPGDLATVAARESEPWARENELQRYRELRVELGSWDRVRAFIANEER